MYKMLCLDLDETLLMPDLSIPDEVIAALRRLEDAGVFVTLATGRMFASARIYARKAGISRPLVVYNGAMIRSADAAEPLYYKPVPISAMREILDLAMSRHWYAQLYHGDDIVVMRKTAETEIDPDLKNAACRECLDFRVNVPGETPKIMTLAEPAEIDRREAFLEERFGDRLYIAKSKPFLLEMMAGGVSKANSLELLCRKYGISPEEAVACGDSDNDAEMLRWAGLGCCVANGMDSVKSICSYVCQKGRAYGVLEVINRFFGV